MSDTSMRDLAIILVLFYLVNKFIGGGFYKIVTKYKLW